MEVDENIKKKLVKNLKSWKEMIDDTIDMYLEGIESAEIVEDIMKIKRDLLIELVYKLPLSEDYCYFCLMKMMCTLSCKNCKYAIYHKQCNDDLSTYARIEKAAHKLIEELERYYQGEKYYE